MSTSSASVLAWSGAATAAVAGLSLLGAGVLAQAQAQTAADLASLAGADSLAAAHGRPCDIAAEAASRNDAVLVSCALRGSDVLVEVQVETAVLPAATARSRAGPSPIDLP